MKDPHNMDQLSTLSIDLMGMIFYPKSSRYAGLLDPTEINYPNEDIKRVGVFVNEKKEEIENQIKKYSFDLVQLHGNELYEDCLFLDKMVPVIKAFSISDKSDIDVANNYGSFRGYYLFDTKTPKYGGSGVKFDWSVVDFYTGDMPFFLSGGISIEDAEQIKNIRHPKFAGIDLNSKFELSPGLKNIDLLETFIKKIRS